jgi:uncharacterized repeat protein (TIGR01451 family)
MTTTWRNWLRRLARSRSLARSRAPRGKRLRLEPLEERTTPTVSIVNNGGLGYTGLDFNQSGGYVPPDTCGAAGPTNYVETVNQTLAIYSPKGTGTTATSDSLTHFFFTVGGLTKTDNGSFESDPIVVYNDQIGRFIVGDQDVDFNTHLSYFDLAVSNSSNPSTLKTTDWNFYQINTTESGFDADYPGNFGYNHDAFVFSLNMFGVSGGGRVQMVSVSNTALASGAALIDSNAPGRNVFHNDLNDFAIRPTAMHDSVANDPMWLVTEHGDNHSIDVIKMGNVLSQSATFAYTNLQVTPYSAYVDPLNPNGTVITNNVDSRIQKSAEWNHTLVATHSVGISSTQSVAQWYKIDVSSGTPVLADQGRISGGNNTYVYYPGIDINSASQIGMTYMKSGTDTSTDYPSMYVTARNPLDPAGTMETPVLVPAGTGQTNYKDFTSGGRAGDLSGINVDPSDGSFWATNEFANTEATANWGTAIANFSIPTVTADLAVGNSGPSSVVAGTNATYTISLTNNGPSAAQNVVLTDTLPTGSVYVSMTPAGNNPDTFNFNQSGGTVTGTATAAVASGNVDSFTLIVSAPGNLGNGSVFDDTASVSSSTPDPNTNNNSATVNGTIVNNGPSADLAVTNSGPASVTAGTNATYTITLTNHGPSAAQGVVLTDALPAGSVFVSMTPSAGNPDTFTPNQSGGSVTETATAAVANGNVDTFTLVVSVPATLANGAAFNDTASVSSSTTDPVPSNNSATVNGTVVNNTSADLAVGNSGPTLVTAGTNATYTITLTNNGPNAAYNVVLSDTLPAGSAFVSMTPFAGNPDGFTQNQSGGSVTETATAAVASGNVDTFTLVVSAPSTLLNGAAFNDTASVTSSTSDPNLSNNSATVNGRIVNNTNADLAVTNSGPASVTTGTNATYTITLTNNGPSAAQGVVLTDTLPAGSTFVSMTPSAGNPDTFTPNQSGGTVTETATAAVASGNVDSFTLVVFAPTNLVNGAVFNDTASVTSSTPDPNTNNNSATVNGTVVNNTPPADLAVTNTAVTTSTEGSNITYTIQVTNNGPNSANGVVLTDRLGANLKYISATTSQGTFTQSGSTVTFSIGTINNGQTVTITVTVQSLEDGNLSSTATATSNNPDPVPGNNSAVATTAVSEGFIAQSSPITVNTSSLSNFTVARFSHANGVEPVSAFTATINWGDGTSSPGTITLSGRTYSVQGSHTYAAFGEYTITVTIREIGNSPVSYFVPPPSDENPHAHHPPHSEVPHDHFNFGHGGRQLPGTEGYLLKRKIAQFAEGDLAHWPI